MTNHPNRSKHQQAPELLAALKACEEYMAACGYFAPNKDLAKQARAAIAKAEGRE